MILFNTAQLGERQIEEWVQELHRKLSQSHFVVQIVPDGELDLKFLTEVGLSIMLDKPITAVVRPGTQVPDKLLRVADRIVEGDPNREAGRAALTEAIDDLMVDVTAEVGRAWRSAHE